MLMVIKHTEEINSTGIPCHGTEHMRLEKTKRTINVKCRVFLDPKQGYFTANDKEVLELVLVKHKKHLVTRETE